MIVLDTHALVWWVNGDDRLSAHARELIEQTIASAGQRVLVSAISAWEIAIKHALGKLPVAPRDFRDELAAAGVAILSIADSHALATSDLPPGHKDPFDRLLLATAQCEGMQLVTADAALLRYAADYPGLPVRQI